MGCLADKSSISLNSDDAIDFIGSLAAKKRLIVQADPANMQNKVSAVFDLSGINKVIDKLEKACGWSKEE